MTAEALSIGDARCAAARALRAVVPTPQLEADIIIALALAVSRESLTGLADVLLSKRQRKDFENLLKRRIHGEPIAYLSGTAEFFSLDFAVNCHTLVPRPETELVIEQVLAHAGEVDAPPRILDLGTGSGIIAVVLASRLENARIHATDISEQALAVAKANARANGVQDRIDFCASDWYRHLPSTAYDIIAANPPYIRRRDPCLADKFMRFEPELALIGGTQGDECIHTIVTGSPAWLKPGGWLVIEHGYDQGEKVRAMMSQAGLGRIETHQDLAGLDRVTEGHRQWQ